MNKLYWHVFLKIFYLKFVPGNAPILTLLVINQWSFYLTEFLLKCEKGITQIMYTNWSSAHHFWNIKVCLKFGQKSATTLLYCLQENKTTTFKLYFKPVTVTRIYNLTFTNTKKAHSKWKRKEKDNIIESYKKIWYIRTRRMYTEKGKDRKIR